MGFTFAHFSDCHIGGWREDTLKQLSIQHFTTAIDICIKEHVDFILISGDLFNTSLPVFDALKEVTQTLKIVKDHGIRMYIIPGSHDYSPSGKTMIDVLEKAGLCVNVSKQNENQPIFTVDKQTGVKLIGLPGLKGGLDKFTYQTLDKTPLEQEEGFKIFLFHTIIDDYKPEFLDMVQGEPLSSLPKNFAYYAGGHPHYVFQKKEPGYGLITYPGPLMPNNFKELETLKHGGFYIVDDKLNIKHIPIELKKVNSFMFDANNKTPEQLQEEILSTLRQEKLEDTIVLVRVKGTLVHGKPSDINFKTIMDTTNCHCFLKNTYKLTSQDFEELTVEQGNVEDVEQAIINEHLGQQPLSFIPKDKEHEFTTTILHLCGKEKNEGETNNDFEQRLCTDLLDTFALDS